MDSKSKNTKIETPHNSHSEREFGSVDGRERRRKKMQGLWRLRLEMYTKKRSVSLCAFVGTKSLAIGTAIAGFA